MVGPSCSVPNQNHTNCLKGKKATGVTLARGLQIRDIEETMGHCSECDDASMTGLSPLGSHHSVSSQHSLGTFWVKLFKVFMCNLDSEFLLEGVFLFLCKRSVQTF